MSDFHYTNNVSKFGFVSFIKVKNPTHMGSSDAVKLVIPCHRISSSASVQIAVQFFCMKVARYSRYTLQEQSVKVGQTVSYKQVAEKMVIQIR